MSVWTIFGRFLGQALAVAGALLALGWAPTRRLAGEEALPAMFAGCAVGVTASLAGTVPLLLARGKPHVEAWTAAMVAMATRLGIAIVLGIALALGGAFPAKPLLVWVVVSHAGLLVPDTLLGLRVVARQNGSAQDGSTQDGSTQHGSAPTPLSEDR